MKIDKNHLISIDRSDISNGKLTIPEDVTIVDMDSCNSQVNLKYVDIPDTVTWVGDGAFSDCKYLKSVKLSKNITEISWYSFLNCVSLEFIVIPENVKTIGVQAFQGSGLKAIVLPAGLECIDGMALDAVFLENILINTNDDSDFERVRNLLPEWLQQKAVKVDYRYLDEHMIASKRLDCLNGYFEEGSVYYRKAYNKMLNQQPSYIITKKQLDSYINKCEKIAEQYKCVEKTMGQYRAAVKERDVVKEAQSTKTVRLFAQKQTFEVDNSNNSPSQKLNYN